MKRSLILILISFFFLTVNAERLEGTSAGGGASASVELTDENFDKLVLKSNDIWLVDFFAPWCPPCKALAPEWTKAANNLQGKAKMGTVNCDVVKGLPGKYSVPGYPEVLIFGKDKTKPEKVWARDAPGLEKVATEALAPKPLQVPREELLHGAGPSASVELTSANFDQMVVQSKDLWLIDFYATWCPPCKALAPEWAKAANNLQGKGPIKLGQINCDNEKDLKAKYAVSAYPTVLFLGADKSTGEECWEREAQYIEEYALEKLQEAKLTSQQVKDERLLAGEEQTANIELTDANFDEMVTNSKDFWLVDFFAPWCPPCKTLLPEWKKAANVLEGKVKMGTVNCDEQKEAASKYPIPHFPTVYFLGADKTTPITFGARDVQSIEKEALEKIESANKEGTANIELTDANFDELVTNSKDFWLVDFFAPWCPPCKTLLPEWKKAANVLEGKVKMGTVNCDEQKEAASKYPIPHFPTVYFLGADKTTPITFGARDVQSIEKEALEKIESQSNTVKAERLLADEEPSANIELTDANFDELVTNSKDVWLIDFFAPWCPPCQALLPEWKKAANILEGKVKMGTVNCDEQKGARHKYRLKGFPTVYMFGPDKTAPVTFYGRNVQKIETEALGLIDLVNEPPLTELTSQEIFTAKCSSSCWLTFLAEEGRADYLDIIGKVSLSTRSFYYNGGIRFVWAAAGKQPELEKFVGVGTSFPTFGGLDTAANTYSIYKGAWEVDPISGFVRALAKDGDIKQCTGAATVVTLPPSHPKYEL